MCNSDAAKSVGIEMLGIPDNRLLQAHGIKSFDSIPRRSNENINVVYYCLHVQQELEDLEQHG